MNPAPEVVIAYLLGDTKQAENARSPGRAFDNQGDESIERAHLFLPPIALGQRRRRSRRSLHRLVGLSFHW